MHLMMMCSHRVALLHLRLSFLGGLRSKLAAFEVRETALSGAHPVGNEILGFTIKAIEESGTLRLINRRDFHRQLVDRTFFQRWIGEQHPAALRAFIVFEVRREANILFVAMCLVRDGGRWDDWPDYLSVLSAAREVTLPIRITDADVELLRASVPRLVRRLKTRDRDDLKNHQHEWLQPRFGPNSIRIGLRFSFRSPPSPPPNGVCLSVLQFLANQARPLTPTYTTYLERPPAATQYTHTAATITVKGPYVYVLPEGDDGPPCVVSLLREFQLSPPTGATLDMVMTSLISPHQWQDSPVDHRRHLESHDLAFVPPTSVLASAEALPDGVERIASPAGAGTVSVAPVLSFIGDQLNTNGRPLVHQGVTDLLTFVSQLGGSFPQDGVTVEKCFLMYRPEAIE
ncbi:unnamed protein product [Vitrella brassicaformis CCMP3155]|uniref:Uncharacterized protein n=1 Tax=Vitrella brassicaformis (strain CCMP3155) TaxID=1169540 RepID=A0A0G4EYC7_VITBC|nr:unnamed protein product [Vitrella brassicaformis CCMP3155]|eukprot:CEM03945.1 unnamed protein product [Vitrella brassicaformis CCMP3155]